MNTPGYYGAASNIWGPDPSSRYYNPLLAFSPPPGGWPQQSSGPSLADQYQMAYDRARKENLERYQDILGGYAERYRRNVKGLENWGDYEQQDIRNTHRMMSTQALADLSNRGLSSTTLAPTLKQGATRAMNRDLGASHERLRAQRAQLDSALSGDMLSFMERRTDAYPDMNQLINLQMLAGQAGPRPGGGVYTQDGQFSNVGQGYGGMNPFLLMAMMRGGRGRRGGSGGAAYSGAVAGGGFGM